MRQRRRGAFGGRTRGDGPHPARAVRAGVPGAASGIPAGISGAAARISAAAGGSSATSCVGFSFVIVRVPLGSAVARLSGAASPATTAAGLFGLGAATGLQRAEASQPVVQRQFNEQLEQQ